MERETTVIKRTIEGLKNAPPYVDRKGFYKYDRVPAGTVKDSIILLQNYYNFLEAMNEYKKNHRKGKDHEKENQREIL